MKTNGLAGLNVTRLVVGVSRIILGLAFFLLFTEIGYAASKDSQQMSTRNRIRIKKKSYVQRVSPDEAEEYSLEKIELLTQKRRDLILDIKRFIREATDGVQKAEFNLRLGALYMEDYHSNLAKSQQVFELQTAAFEKNNNKKQKPPQLDSSEAIASLEKARAIYRDLLQKYPNHVRRDEMYYFLALTSLDRGKMEEAMSFFKLLSEQHPKSRFVNDALVQLGDYYFDANNFTTAEGYYDKIIHKKHMPLIAYATYKKAWCSYNNGKTQLALNLMKWVIDREESSEGNSSSSIRIRGEALKDITLPFTDLKLVDDSIAFFKSHGDPHYRKGLEMMALLYNEAGEYGHAIKLWDNLLAMDANHIKNPTYEVKTIDALKMKHQDDEAIARLFSTLPNYLSNSNWYEINSSNPVALKEATSQYEETAWKYAMQYHAEAQRTKNESRYALASNIYAKYLEFFPRHVHAAKARYQLAEILYKQTHYIEAAEHYYRVYQEPAAQDLKYDAIRSALMSLDRQLNLDRKKQGLAEISSKLTAKISDKEALKQEPTPMSEVESRFLSFSEEYLKAYPKAKDAGDVMYEMAYLQYIHYDFNASYKNFWTLLQNYPSHETAYSSSHLILDILNRRQDFPRLVAACKKFLTMSTLTKPGFRADVADILRRGELKRIQTIEEKGEFKLAADQYTEYTKAYGSQDEALFEKALYNASVNFSKAEFFLLAAESQEKFLRRFPKSALRENMLLQVAKTYELLATFEKAANYYELFSSQYPRNAQAKDALRLSGLYYWGAGNVRKAETVMTSYLRLYPNDRKLGERDLLELYESQNATDRLVQYYLNARAAKGLPASDYVAYTLKVAEIQAKNRGSISPKLMAEALRTSQTFARELAKTPKGVDSMSKLLFWYTSQKDNTFYKLKLALPQRQLEINLQKKLALLKEIEKEYSRVAGLGSPEWGLGAMYKTAAAYHAMAQEIMQAPVPAELTGEQVELYRSEIEKTFIKPFNEKALLMASQCLDKAQEFNLLTSWAAKCYSVASEVDGARYPLVRTFYLQPFQLAVMAPKKSSKILAGNIKNYAYPFLSFGLFNPQVEARALASAPADSASLYGDAKGLTEGPGSTPLSLNYRVLSDERKEILGSAVNAERPSDLKHGSSFAFLNLIRVTAPQRALPLILEAIQKDPNNPALHNLLGLAYLELGNYPAAKVTWLAMMARGVKNAALWNNLGVLAFMEGRESQAQDYFQEALLMEDPKEPLVNLGFVALKYRNGFEAKKYFEKAIAIEKAEVISQVGYAVALIQNRELEAAKDKLLDLTRRYKTDPFSRISLGYFLMDVEKESDLANRILAEYIDAQAIENDMQFREAIQETRRRGTASTPEELPSIQ